MVWFDLDNSPHVPLFRPLFAEMTKRNEDVLVTSRMHAQTEDLLQLWQIKHTVIGVHGGKSKVRKVTNLLHRSYQLHRFARSKGAQIGVSHGSRAQLLACKALGIPHIWMTDYEYTEKMIANTLATYILMPSYIPDDRLKAAGFNMRKVIRYAGFKEEIYLKDFVPDPAFREKLNVDSHAILITIRPPSVSANYHDKKAELLFQECLRRFAGEPQVCCLVVNRTSAEMALIPEEARRSGNVSVLSHPVDGLQLLWSSDIVISGGGTMNRESALLGVPTYSIFTGRRPYLDEHLVGSGRLTFVEEPGQVHAIPLQKRVVPASYQPTNSCLASQLAEMILGIRKNGRPVV